VRFARDSIKLCQRLPVIQLDEPLPMPHEGLVGWRRSLG
jgi:hypothetical protein